MSRVEWETMSDKLRRRQGHAMFSNKFNRLVALMIVSKALIPFVISIHKQ